MTFSFIKNNNYSKTRLPFYYCLNKKMDQWFLFPELMSEISRALYLINAPTNPTNIQILVNFSFFVSKDMTQLCQYSCQETAPWLFNKRDRYILLLELAAQKCLNEPKLEWGPWQLYCFNWFVDHKAQSTKGNRIQFTRNRRSGMSTLFQHLACVLHELFPKQSILYLVPTLRQVPSLPVALHVYTKSERQMMKKQINGSIVFHDFFPLNLKNITDSFILCDKALPFGSHCDTSIDVKV